MSSEPKYQDYSVDELFDVLKHVDKDLYPEKVEQIKLEIARRSNTEIATAYKPFRFTKSDGYCLLFFCGLGLIIFSIFSGELPISRSVSVQIDIYPHLYWFVFAVWTVITLCSGYKWYTADNDT
ncbi:hypothetical protein [Colwellia sp. UCD-KL20]|uniref:hypothetical protein n=1 Tax=Colwellia sp. UCD-KL20 TaxID=1917165 RepID=UPI0009710939|nr:hypothetical protein [Colwellia sp. UCD-KL20]